MVIAMAACAAARQPLNYAPLGAGQFQNGEAAKGVAFALAEGATAATSAGIWLYLRRSYPQGFVTVTEAPRVRTLETIELTTGIAFFGVYALGVVDALVHYRGRVQLAPMFVGGGPGVALCWSR